MIAVRCAGPADLEAKASAWTSAPGVSGVLRQEADFSGAFGLLGQGKFSDRLQTRPISVLFGVGRRDDRVMNLGNHRLWFLCPFVPPFTEACWQRVTGTRPKTRGSHAL